MNFKIKLAGLLVFCCMALSLQAQTDSLFNLVNSKTADTVKIEAYNKLSRIYLSSNPDSAIILASNASELARKIKDYPRLGTSLKNVGLGYFYQADYKNVLGYWLESLSAFEQANDAKGTANLLSNIGAVYYQSGDNTKAIDYYLRALRIAEDSGDDERLATVLQNIGAVYESTKEFDKAEDYLSQAIEICKLLEYDKGIATVALNLGDIYFQQDNYALAETYFLMARDYFEKLDDNYLATPIMNLGLIESKKGNYSKALSYLNEASEIALSKKSNLERQLIFNAFGDVYLKQNKAQKAIDAYNNAYEIGKTIGVNEDLKETYEGLTKAYKKLGNYKMANQFQDSLLNTATAIYNIEKNNQIENLQLTYEIGTKEKEIDLLNADNELKSAQIARAKLFRNFLLAVAALLVVVVGGVAYQYNYVRKTNKIITEERNKSDRLLLNILPKETADELKHRGKVAAKKHDSATVLFTDFVNFTGTAGKMPPEELVKTVDYYFRNFDAIIKKYDLEKIKTIGDAYMCASGIPKENPDNVENALRAAADMVRFVNQTAENPPEGIKAFQIRIGLNCGPLVAGVVGSTKFQYDIWGDTVNIAARMETNSAPNRINVSENVYETLKHKMNFEYRGELDVKNKGKMKMYFLDHASVN